MLKIDGVIQAKLNTETEQPKQPEQNEQSCKDEGFNHILDAELDRLKKEGDDQ